MSFSSVAVQTNPWHGRPEPHVFTSPRGYDLPRRDTTTETSITSPVAKLRLNVTDELLHGTRNTLCHLRPIGVSDLHHQAYVRWYISLPSWIRFASRIVSPSIGHVTAAGFTDIRFGRFSRTIVSQIETLSNTRHGTVAQNLQNLNPSRDHITCSF